MLSELRANVFKETSWLIEKHQHLEHISCLNLAPSSELLCPVSDVNTAGSTMATLISQNITKKKQKTHKYTVSQQQSVWCHLEYVIRPWCLNVRVEINQVPDVAHHKQCQCKSKYSWQQLKMMKEQWSRRGNKVNSPLQCCLSVVGGSCSVVTKGC